MEFCFICFELNLSLSLSLSLPPTSQLGIAEFHVKPQWANFREIPNNPKFKAWIPEEPRVVDQARSTLSLPVPPLLC